MSDQDTHNCAADQMVNANVLTKIEWDDNWGGGRFKPKLSAGVKVTIITGGQMLHATLTQGSIIYGSDSDCGRREPWHFQDYCLSLPDDTFNRRTSLLYTLKDATIAVYLGHIPKTDLMRYRDHRGGYDEAMATQVVLSRTTEALCDHLNAQEHAIFLHRQVLPSDLEYRIGNYDKRNGWNTIWVKVTGFGVVGCIDGMISGTSVLSEE